MMQQIGRLEQKDLTLYLANLKLVEVGAIRLEEFQSFYRELSMKYRFNIMRTYITFKEGLVFEDLPDPGSN